MGIDPQLVAKVTELVSNTTNLAAVIAGSATLKTVFGGLLSDAGEIVRLPFKNFLLQQQVKVALKTKEMLEAAGVKPSPVGMKLLLPILEGATFEEDEDLHTMWAALLANAANPETAEMVQPSFIATLRQLTHRDALVLAKGFEVVSESVLQRRATSPDEMLARSLSFIVFNPWNHEPGIGHRIWSDEEAITYANLQSTFLIERSQAYGGSTLNLTCKGYYFMLACQSPKKK